MKILILLTVCFLSIHIVNAQEAPPIGGCILTYSYDAAGNRVQRMNDCRGTGNESGKSAPKGVDSTGSTSSSVDSFQIITIAPNPTGGPITITCNQNMTNASVSILDMNGQVVSQAKANGWSFPMDISSLPPASYIVVVTSNGNRTARTIIKK
jgi:hypothetical protein